MGEGSNCLTPWESDPPATEEFIYMATLIDGKDILEERGTLLLEALCQRVIRNSFSGVVVVGPFKRPSGNLHPDCLRGRWPRDNLWRKPYVTSDP